VVTLREEITREYPDAVLELSRMLVQAGQLITEKPNIAAEIAVSFLDPNKTLGLKVPVLRNVLTEPQGIRTDDLFPVREDFERLQDYMVREMEQGRRIKIDDFLDTRFAEEACKEKIVRRKTAAATAVAEPSAASATAKAMLEKEGKYLSFSLNAVEYGIGILKIREIIGMLPITPVPHAPPAVKGVINLRGKVIPVVDLRLRFGLPEISYHDRTCIIVLETQTSGGSALMGVVVDSVSEVLHIKAEQIEERPHFGSKQQLDFIIGLAKSDRDLKVLLDIDGALNSKDAGQLGQLPSLH
jgi:chemotaxis signal transduction protein